MLSEVSKKIINELYSFNNGTEKLIIDVFPLTGQGVSKHYNDAVIHMQENRGDEKIGRAYQNWIKHPITFNVKRN